MNKPFNPLLERQLRDVPALGVSAAHEEFLSKVSAAYDDHERTRKRLERAMRLMNEELQEQMSRQVTLLESLKDRTSQFETTLSSIHQGLILSAADGSILIGNDRFAQMLGYSGIDQIKAISLQDSLVQAPAFQTHYCLKTHRQQDDLLQFATSTEATVLHIKADADRTYELEKICDGDQGYVVAIQDITESVLSQRLERLVNHDPLTGLASRHAFNTAIENASRSMQFNDGVTLLCMDLDRFKVVNDTQGHAFGDELLKQVATRLETVSPDTAIIARLGGDEFAILIQTACIPGDAAALANRIISAIGKPFEIENQIVKTGVSIGIAQSPEHGRDPGLLLKRADIALYRAKAIGGNQYRIFSHKMEASFAERTRLEADLKSAVANNQLELHFQPIVCAKTHNTTGFEALVRWRHPHFGLVGPDKFIPIAEKTGLINLIGQWVLKAALGEAVQWPKQYSISVNLSAVQFWNRQLVQDVTTALAKTGFEPNRLHLEITESVLLDQSEFTRSILTGLRHCGVNINLDDFGAGYSSFNYILEFGFQRVKIDKVFLQDKFDREKAHAILTAISGFCKNLGIETVAEGVETAADLDFISQINVNALQGYYFSRPVDSKNARQLMDWDDGSALESNVA